MSRHFSLVAIGLVAGVLAEPSAAQSPPEGLVWMALRDINETYFDRDDPTNRPALATRPPVGMIRAVNVSRDGKPDWLVDYSKTDTSHFCGTGGCLQRLYVSTDDGYVRAFDQQALEFEVTERAGGRGVEVMVHHSYCTPERSECRFAWAWDTEQRRLVERPAIDGVTILTGGGFAPIEAIPEERPQDIAQAAERLAVACPPEGDRVAPELRPVDAHPTVDLNGDGIRDWFIQPPGACAADGATAGFRVMLSEEGGFTEAYRSDPDRYPSVDIAQTPAALVINPPCGYGETCPNERLRWDSGVGQFVRY